MIANASPPGPKRTSVRLLIVGSREAGMRLDRLVKLELPQITLSQVQKLLRTGQVRVDSRRRRGNHRLAVGEQVRIPPMFLPDEGTRKRGGEGIPGGVVTRISGRILYRDDALLVIDKPSGLAVHGGSGRTWGVVDVVRGLAESFEEPELCHRLDRDTSGCLLFGLKKEVTRQLAAGFRDGRMKKGYLALVRGCPEPLHGVIDRPLKKGVVLGGERMVVTTDRGEGQAARSHYRVLGRFARASLLQVTLETGRTHQIRVHCQSIGHPLAGDWKYGDRDFNQEMKRQGLARLFLHAHWLEFPHPVRGHDLRVEAPLEPVLSALLERLRSPSSGLLSE